MHNFTSPFGKRIAAMLDFRESCGYKRETYLKNLFRFDQYCSQLFPKASELTCQLVHSWLDNETKMSHNLHASAAAIRYFGKYLDANGEDAYVLMDKFASNKSKSAPYIFTDSELAMLFAAADSLPECSDEPFLSEIAPVLFRLIYTCGLRPNEGRELLLENVNLDNGEILITRTKQNKERIIVMSDDMCRLAYEYDMRRRIFAAGSPFFFPAKDGGCFSSKRIRATLNNAWARATCTPQNPIPTKIRVYDLRHQFASACLNRWLDEGENLMAMMPYLRAYMGHASMNETAYYIHILPENLIKSSAIDWSKLNAVIPEVAG